MFEKQKIFILGMARSGYEVAKLLATHNNQILITAPQEENEDHIHELEQLGVKVVITEHQLELLDDSFDYLVKNPGISFENPVLLKAQELDIPIVNEVEVAYHFLPEHVKIIGITGSNGKTTTTTLIYELLKRMDLPVHLGGNIGIPVSALIPNVKENDILVLEISGHQLHDMYDFKTDISVMTNLCEVHLDHFHTYENYKYYKSMIFRNHTENDLAIINGNDADVLEVTEHIPSKKITFSAFKTCDLYLQDQAIYDRGQKVIDTKDIRIKGNHNYENIMCAIAVAKQFGLTNEVLRKFLHDFGGVEHRMEYVDKVNGRIFYNDSKATNVKSTQIALSSFTTPVILIMGGLDRNHPFDELKPYLTHVTHVICYGETKSRIKEFMDSIQMDCVSVDVLEEAVKVAYRLSQEGDTILLSPACASWDQFKNFEVRGTEYKRFVKRL